MPRKLNNPGKSVIEQTIRRTARCGMTDGSVMRIEFISGFELFNDRPYHNYETWGQGWRVSGLGIRTEAEGLDDAIEHWAELVRLKRDGQEVSKYYLYDDILLLADWIEPKEPTNATE